MKKSFYSLLLGALMVSCASNDPMENNTNNGPEVQGYLSVNIVAPGGMGTRAGEGDEGNPSDPTDTPSVDGQYEYGQTNENYVKEVRLYFFDDEGNGVGIRKDPLNDDLFYSYYDWDPTPAENATYPEDYEEGEEYEAPNNPPEEPENETIEKVLTVMVALTAKNAEFPTQVAAIINPTQAVKDITRQNMTPSLQKLQEAVFDNLTGLTDNNFLMSSSAYINKIGDLTITQPVSEETNLKPTQVQAKESPINLYVERVVARLDMTFDQLQPVEGEGPADGIYNTGTKVTTEDRAYGEEGEKIDPQLTDEDIYVKFLGWAVTSTPNSSYVIKKINAGWGTDEVDGQGFFGVINQPWYIYQYHRSFWATNPPLSENPAENAYTWYTFNELSGENSVKQLGFPMTETQTYMQENANPNPGTTAADPKQPTKVIFAAQLVNSQGQPVEITEWNGVYFTRQGLKNLAARMLDMYYIEPGTGEGTVPAKYVKISPEQITFITASQFENNRSPLFPKENVVNYTVYATLTSDANASDKITGNAASLTWYHLNDNVQLEKATADDFTKIEASNINNYMQRTFGNAKIWNNGYTYYYYTIRHFGAPDFPGYYGVVRNHIYKGTVDGLTGLGTPVWDPNEVIFPEKPSPNGNNLSVKINVLSWRLVTDSYDFEW